MKSNAAQSAYTIYHMILTSDLRCFSPLYALYREMGVDVLITGNSHAVEVWQSNDGGIFVSPGSVRMKPLGTPIFGNSHL